MKTKTLSYLRVSGKGQIDGDGFPRQRESVTNYARRNRMEIVNEFRDEGVTGTLFDRPGLTELFLALKAGDVKVVLVEKADRLARDLIVSETLLAEFRKLGVKVVAAEGGIHRPSLLFKLHRLPAEVEFPTGKVNVAPLEAENLVHSTTAESHQQNPIRHWLTGHRKNLFRCLGQ